ncbi:MAG: hypothetical protein Q9159_003359 [Coniocarpon cinnabarinum]
MNDQGLQKPISDASHQLDGPSHETTEEEEEERAFLDPRLLIVNAISLASALAANGALLINMGGRHRFAVAQAVTIFGFAIAAVLLLGIIGATSRQSFIGPAEDHVLTQAFYYAIWAAAIYIIVTILMTLTSLGAWWGKYPKEFNLTPSQRTLMLQTISFMAYLLIGALIFSTVENWRYLDAVYFADFTLLTIGIGLPLTPVSHTGRALIIPFALGGIMSVGLIVGSIRSMLLEAGEKKMRARTTEKARARVHSFADVKNHRPGPLPNSKKYIEPASMPIEERRRQEFKAMRQIQRRASTRARWSSLGLSMVAALVLWFIGALVFEHTEHKQGWSYFVSLYFTYISLLTIGYGDFQPLSNSGRSFFVFWSLLAVPTLTVLISDMGDTVVKGIAEATNWIGSITILPHHMGRSAAWREVAAATWMLFHPGLTETDHEHAKSAKDVERTDSNRRIDFASMLRKRLGNGGIHHCNSFTHAQDQSKHHQDHFFYHWVLVREVNNVWKDTQLPEPKEYTYDEWKYFLRLLGHDEHKPELQRRPNPRPHRGLDEEPQIGRPIDKHGRIRPWSWMGFRSPLMSPKDDPTWVLQQLVAKMQREMDDQALERTDDSDVLPVSLDMLSDLDRASSVSGSSSKPEQQDV